MNDICILCLTSTIQMFWVVLLLFIPRTKCCIQKQSDAQWCFAVLWTSDRFDLCSNTQTTFSSSDYGTKDSGEYFCFEACMDMYRENGAMIICSICSLIAFHEFVGSETNSDYFMLLHGNILSCLPILFVVQSPCHQLTQIFTLNFSASSMFCKSMILHFYLH